MKLTSISRKLLKQISEAFDLRRSVSLSKIQPRNSNWQYPPESWFRKSTTTEILKECRRCCVSNSNTFVKWCMLERTLLEIERGLLKQIDTLESQIMFMCVATDKLYTALMPDKSGKINPNKLKRLHKVLVNYGHIPSLVHNELGKTTKLPLKGSRNK